MKKKSIITLIATLTLVGALGVGATLAYMTDSTGTLTNKFVFAEAGIGLELDEAKVDENNKATSDRISAGTAGAEQTYAKLVPGSLIDKDPTVTVLADSVNCNVFVSVNNANGTNLTINDMSADWVEITAADYGFTAAADTKYYVYAGADATGVIEEGDTYKVVANSTEDLRLTPVFTQVQVSPDLASAPEGGLSDIVIKAVAVQADSCTDNDAVVEALGMLGAAKAGN